MAKREYIVTITDEVDKDAFKKFEEQYQAERFYRCIGCANYNELMEQCIVDGSFCDPTAYCCNVEPKDGEQET